MHKFHRRCTILLATVTSMEGDAPASDSNACVRHDTLQRAGLFTSPTCESSLVKQLLCLLLPF